MLSSVSAIASSSIASILRAQTRRYADEMTADEAEPAGPEMVRAEDAPAPPRPAAALTAPAPLAPTLLAELIGIQAQAEQELPGLFDNVTRACARRHGAYRRLPARAA